MRFLSISIFCLLFLVPGCAAPKPTSLSEARQGFQTHLTPSNDQKQAAEVAPASVFRTLKYPAASGNLTAYVSPDPHDGKKHPAIVWITGGDCNSIGDVWSPAPATNDQTAAAYRKTGIVMMFPSLRGGNDNPGEKEGFLGEVDDVLAATKWLENQPYVDTKRIYLGGHSTGGTLVMLVAESSDRFRSVFAFGPVAVVSSYGADSGFLPFDITQKEEVKVRSPGYWLNSVHTPLWVFEGTSQSNIASLNLMKQISKNPSIHFLPVQGQGSTHFTILSPTNSLIAQKIIVDSGENTNINFTEGEVNDSFVQSH